MAHGSKSVIVWEWANDIGGWTPYEPTVSNAVSDFHAQLQTSRLAKSGSGTPARSTRSGSSHLSSAGVTSVLKLDSLSSSSNDLNGQFIDLKQMSHLTSPGGISRRIQEKQYSIDSPTAKGIHWQFEDNGKSWQSFNTDVSEELERLHQQGQFFVDLSQSSFNIPYLVDLKKMVQIRLHFGTKRPIRRLVMKGQYKPTSKATTTKTLDQVVPGSMDNMSSGMKAQGSTDDLKQFLKSTVSGSNDEDCIICMMPLEDEEDDDSDDTDVVQLKGCDHLFHKECLHRMYESGTKDGHLTCPICKRIYGQKRGSCPRGRMSWRLEPGMKLAGFPDADAIYILYEIPSGVQGPEHPHPGKRYSANFPRHALLPNTPEGRKVLQLLQVAWARRLTFTVGTSVTTGHTDTVTWNEIHHKTQPTGEFGFPDPKYLGNVTSELAAQGVSEQDLGESD